MEVLNPEKLYFYRNPENILKVSCREPVEIVNHRTGYFLRYVLENFQYDYNSNETVLSGKCHFEELTPRNSRQKTIWEKNRREVYAISITHFFRALYRRKIHEDGFLLVERDSIQSRKSLFPLKDILQTNREQVLVNIETPLYLACLSRPVTDNMIKNTYNTLFGVGVSSPVTLLMPQQFSIYSDGTYTGMLQLQEYRNSITGLSSMLPFEYLPDSTEPAYQNSIAGLSSMLSGDNLQNGLAFLFDNQLALFPQEKI